MTTQTIRKRRTRVTQKDIERARQELAQPKEAPTVRPKHEKETPRYKKDFWYGLVYCDSYGHCWISDFEPVPLSKDDDCLSKADEKPVYLGKTDEFIPYLKSKRIDGESVDIVLIAAKEFWSEKKSHSCHLASGNGKEHISIPSDKPIVATFRKDSHFLASLNELISKGYGIRVIHSKLKGQGYEIPMRTLGRWVNKEKTRLKNIGDKHEPT